MKTNRREFNVGLLGAVGALAVHPFQDRLRPLVNSLRLNQHISALAEIGKNPQGGVSRVAYT
ncbi:MAG: hypothetical protein ACRD8U_01380, partial [Pyrinomonadaceae bacterium]